MLRHDVVVGCWVVVVPVKPLVAAKSRLGRAADRQRLALGFAQDTVAAALAGPLVAEVLVVTGDPAVAAALGGLGASVVPDKPDAGLNAAVTFGADLAGHRPVAALAADLPALRTADLSAALAAARSAARCFVPDATGTGTVLLTAAVGVPLDPRFGARSAAAHLASGAVRLAGPWPSLRRDVDTPADLAAAAALGLGPHTASLLR